MPKNFNHFYWNGSEITREVVALLNKWNSYLKKHGNDWGTLLWTSSAILNKKPSMFGVCYRPLQETEKTANGLVRNVDYYFLEKKKPNGTVISLGMAGNFDQLLLTYKDTCSHLIKLYQTLVSNQHYAFAADIVRLLVLNELPGFYMDIDHLPPRKMVEFDLEKIKHSFIEKGLGTLKFAIAIQGWIDETNSLLALQKGGFTEVIQACDFACEKYPSILQKEIEILTRQRKETKAFFNVRRDVSELLKQYSLILSDTQNPTDQTIVLTTKQLATGTFIQYKVLDPFNQEIVASFIPQKELEQYLGIEASRNILRALETNNIDLISESKEKIITLIAKYIFIPNHDFELYIHAYKEKNAHMFNRLNLDQGVYLVDVLRQLQKMYEITINAFHAHLQSDTGDLPKDIRDLLITAYYLGGSEKYGCYLKNYNELFGQYRETEQDGLHLYSWGNPGYGYLRKVMPQVQKIKHAYLHYRCLKATSNSEREQRKFREIEWLVAETDALKQASENEYAQANRLYQQFICLSRSAEPGSMAEKMHEARSVYFEKLLDEYRERLDELQIWQCTLKRRSPKITLNQNRVSTKDQFFQASNIFDSVKAFGVIYYPVAFSLYPFDKLTLKGFLEDHADRLISDLRSRFKTEKRLRMSKKEVDFFITSLFQSVVKDMEKNHFFAPYIGSFDTSEAFEEKKKILLLSTMRSYCQDILKRMLVPYYPDDFFKVRAYIPNKIIEEKTIVIRTIAEEGLYYQILNSAGELPIKLMPYDILKAVVAKVTPNSELQEKLTNALANHSLDKLVEVLSTPAVAFFLQSYLKEMGDIETDLSRFLNHFYLNKLQKKVDDSDSISVLTSTPCV